MSELVHTVYYSFFPLPPPPLLQIPKMVERSLAMCTQEPSESKDLLQSIQFHSRSILETHLHIKC